MTINSGTFKKGHKLSKESLKKISIALKGKMPKNMKIIGWNKGKHFSEEHKKKISEAQKGIPRPYSRMKKGIKMSVESRKKMSTSALGKILSSETKDKIRAAMIKRMSSVDVRKGISNKLKGSNSYNWKGGISSENLKIRNSLEYRLWRESVFLRDNYTCLECGVRGGVLHAHHIKQFCRFPELRTAIDNGITLCIRCHKIKHKKK